MTPRNRKTLSDYFSNGQMPTQESFGDLIHSMVNIVDDGFDKNAADGMKIAQVDNGGKLISFYDKTTGGESLWSVAFTVPGYGAGAENNRNLNFFYGSNRGAGLTLASAPESGTGQSGERKIRVGVNNGNPRHEMDVNGVVASDGRIGREGRKGFEVRADGEWHPVRTGLDGCQAFEVMAGVGKPRSGRYALMHAFALSTFNSGKSSITYHQARFSSRCDQIELRWTGTTHDYSLEMRVRCSYEQNDKEEIYIRYYLTELWFDPFMESGAANGPDSREGEA